MVMQHREEHLNEERPFEPIEEEGCLEMRLRELLVGLTRKDVLSQELRNSCALRNRAPPV